jgi:hypothetical protein
LHFFKYHLNTGKDSGKERKYLCSIKINNDKFMQYLMEMPVRYKITMTDQIPSEFVLYQNFPQTFYRITKIAFDLPVDSHVKLMVYDIFGREVAVLFDDFLKAGSFEVKWNALNVKPGIYYYKIKSGDFVDSKKMFLLNNN